MRQSVTAFRRHARFPSEGVAAPASMPGVYWSEHWSFWQEGYPALMITDTAPFRNPAYHSAADTPDRIAYAAMTPGSTGSPPSSGGRPARGPGPGGGGRPR